MEILIDSTVYSKKLANDLKDMAKKKFKEKKPKIRTPKYLEKEKK